MQQYHGLILGFLVVCALVLLLSAINRKSEMLLNFVFRLVVGTVLICFGNIGVAMLGMTGAVDLNLFTLLTTGILGTAWVAALFGIYFCRALV